MVLQMITHTHIVSRYEYMNDILILSMFFEGVLLLKSKKKIIIIIFHCTQKKVAEGGYAAFPAS